MKVCVDGIVHEIDAADIIEPVVEEIPVEPTFEERLDAIEAALLEKILKEAASDV